MPPLIASRARTLVPFAAAAALVGLGTLALSSASSREASVRRAVEAELQAELTNLVSSWEMDLLRQLEGIHDDALAENQNPSVLEKRLRKRHDWFDSLYIWEGPMAQPEGLRPVSLESRFIFPLGGHGDPSVTPSSACLMHAWELHTEDEAPPTTEQARAAAHDYVEGCEGESLPVRTLAATEAARRLREAGLTAEALTALPVSGLADDAPLNMHVELGVSERLRFTRRLLAAELLLDSGDERGLRDIARTVAEASRLATPVLEDLQYLLLQAISTLEDAGRDVSALERALALAEQRVSTFREVKRQADSPASRSRTQGPRFVPATDEFTPLAMYIQNASEDRRGLALLLDEDALVQDFVRHGAGHRRETLLVVNSLGMTRHGSRTRTAQIKVPFSRTLRYLSAAFPEETVEARVADLADSSILWTNLITLLCMILGAGALVEQVRASTRHRALLARQREFTTRVTHELRTPLAGIRVMAENLADGAFRDSAHRTEMAERIIDEADRLTARVDKILQVSRKVVVPKMEVLDLEEVCLELLEVWFPRYQEAGIELTADFEPAEPVLGHHDSLVSAIDNLLDNALKYRRTDVDSAVWFNLRDLGDWTVVEVLDNGLGVPREDREEIFEHFVRVEGDNRGLAGGTGLGLAQVAKIAENHKGSVRCEEGVDGGSRFVLQLPVPKGS